jgi:RNA polymerase sigma-70 factor (ECF subfamily)
MVGWLMLPIMAEEPDDRALMSRYRNGDVEAFELLYSRHKGPLYRYFLRRGMHPEAASELFQEVWTRIIRSKDRYRPTAKFTTYMYQLAHNCYVDHVRLQARAPTHHSSTDIDPDGISGNQEDNPENQAAQSQLREQFRQALETLPEEQREALVLREEGGLSLADIATVTGVSPETAKSRLRYGVKKLREIFNSRDDTS